MGVVMVVTLAGVGLFVGLRLYARDPALTLDNALRRNRSLYALLAVMALFGAVSLIAYGRPRWLWSLPLSVEVSFDVYMWRSVVGLLAFSLALTTSLAFAAGDRRRWVLAVVSLALVTSLSAAIDDRTRPIAPELAVVERDGVVLQSSHATCVSASAANLLRLYDIDVTEQRMAALLHASRLGATSGQLMAGMRELGVHCQRSFDPSRDVTRLMPPAIIFYGESFGVPHAVVFAERSAEGSVVLDPLKGRVTLEPATLADRWDGEAVHCTPP